MRVLLLHFRSSSLSIILLSRRDRFWASPIVISMKYSLVHRHFFSSEGLILILLLYTLTTFICIHKLLFSFIINLFHSMLNNYIKE